MISGHIEFFVCEIFNVFFVTIVIVGMDFVIVVLLCLSDNNKYCALYCFIKDLTVSFWTILVGDGESHPKNELGAVGIGIVNTTLTYIIRKTL